MIKFAFIGGTIRGYKLLEALIENNFKPVYSVILKEDEHESEKYSPKILSLLKKHKLHFSIRKKLLPEDYKILIKGNLDFAIVYGWRSIIDPELNEQLKFGMIASHHSLLPKYRGFAPVQWAVINGEKETGATLFKINKDEIDSGEIIAQSKTKILPDESGFSIDEKIVSGVLKMYLKFFDDYKKNKVKLLVQDESKATYTCKRIPEDGRINWDQKSVNIYNLIRAVSHPYPGAFCFYNEINYQILKAMTGKNNTKKFSGKIPGRVYRIHKNGIEVLCGEGTILIEEWKNMKTGETECPSRKVKSLNATLK